MWPRDAKYELGDDLESQYELSRRRSYLARYPGTEAELEQVVMQQRAGGRVGRDAYPKPDLESLYKEFAGRAIWFEHVYNYPTTANGIVVVLTHLERCMGEMIAGNHLALRNTRTSLASSRFTSGMGPADDDGFLEHQQVAMRAARSLDPDYLSRRAPHLDPDSYALEVMRTAQDQMNIVQNFQGVVDMWADYFTFDPIFVIRLADWEVYGSRGQQTFLDQLTPILPRQMRIIVCGDGPMPFIRFNRKAHHQCHIMNVAESIRLQNALERVELGRNGFDRDVVAQEVEQYREEIGVYEVAVDRKNTTNALIKIEYIGKSGLEGARYYSPDDVPNALATFRNECEGARLKRVLLVKADSDDLIEEIELE